MPHHIHRKFPGRSAEEIYSRVDEVMERIAAEMSLDYRTDEAKRTGAVGRMGIRGTYAVREGEVTVELHYPVLVPGTLRRKVEDHIGEKLDGLFG
jgi:hypothetical protein